ncbi:sulfatase [Flavivirga aquimarina]|uniref:Sulfatase n=1 Tax=Flavivirga aquimarina TaxID=2027862 RepID=A0ABT8W949_9FLAO|nr:sulfatase [Flavivirga aquimarina]MDO5969592.1 sulfatase [Flavivirga aquimarina]
MKNRKSLLTLALTICFFSNYVNSQKKDNAIQPNIIIFYADDLGWQDTELNNLNEPTPWETPNILKLANESVNFTNAYSPAPSCAPSRCAMLTGLHPAKTGITHVAGGRIPDTKYSTHISPFYPLGLSPEHFTIAEALKMNGYKTGHVGKWHMGDLKIQKSTNQGFDFAFESRGAHQGSKKPNNRLTNFATYSDKDPYRLSDEKYPPFTKNSPKGISYPKDDVTEKALEFIDKSKEEPFFLYLAHWMVHYPIHTKNRELLQYYCDKLGVDFPKEDIPMSSEGQTNPYYGSMVTTLDWSLGRIVEYLKKTEDPRNPGKKLFETTYIIFSSDNGGTERHGKEIITDNYPLDKGKQFNQEGGIRVPMLISGPNIAKASTYNGLMNQLDLFPTILNITNTKIPAKYSSDFDGLDISGVLINNESVILNKNGKPREDLWWHFPHNRDSQMQSAIRSGDYKLYKNLIDGSYELYRLYKDGKRYDLEEKNDISKQDTQVTQNLSAKLEKYLKDYKAQYPYKNPLEKKDYLGKENAIYVPKIIKDVFDSKTNRATVELERGKSKINDGYALIKVQDKIRKKSNEKKAKTKSTYLKIPINTNEAGLSFSFKVPKEAKEYCIVLIDENQFIIKSKLNNINEL